MLVCKFLFHVWNGNGKVINMYRLCPIFDPILSLQPQIRENNRKKYERMRSLFLYDVCIRVAVVGS